MGLKKKIGMGLATATLGASLIAGGSFAYFSDQAESQSTFTAGTLDLSMNPEVIVDLDGLKPGDRIVRDFELSNSGNLDIAKINLGTSYNVTDVAGDNDEDLGKYIRVNFLWNWDKEKEPIFETTLDQLRDMSPDVVEKNLQPLIKGGLEPGETNDLWVEFEFVDNGEDQNNFQGDGLKLKWQFNATQGDGTAYDGTN
ncbi:TasA family protein [Virgibacillus halophilus]|uniref:TasA family protein n=1 Tax=Tigheibacillus halophilus TaxID=361280 RepID=A0ABU5C3A2_9BACI|nr:TasA family protein [Virgibacillus halophilus]